MIRVILVIVFHRTRSASLPGTSWSSRCSSRSPGPGGTVPSIGACRWRRRPRTAPAPWPRADTGHGERSGTARKSRTPVKAGWSHIFAAPCRSGPDPKPDFRVGSSRSGTGLGTGSGFSSSCGWQSCSLLLIQKTDSLTWVSPSGALRWAVCRTFTATSMDQRSRDCRTLQARFTLQEVRDSEQRQSSFHQSYFINISVQVTTALICIQMCNWKNSISILLQILFFK